MEDGVVGVAYKGRRIGTYGYLHQELIPTRLHTAAWPASGEPSETGDHAILSVDNPARLSKYNKYTSTGTMVKGIGVHTVALFTQLPLYTSTF